MKNFVDSGKSIVVTSAGAKTAGVPIVVGDLVGIPAATVATNVPVVVMLSGTYELDKATGAAWAQGATLYWDNAAKNCTTADGAGANKQIGHAAVAAASGDTAGSVRLSA